MYSCENVWVKVLLSKGWMVAVGNSVQALLMEKKQTEGEEGRVNGNEFSGVKSKT